VHDGTSGFALWLVPSPTFEPADLTALSSDFGEALSIAVQTIADLIIYDRFVDGSRVRGLTYAGEAGWVRVTGTPEPWEPPTLFSAAKLDELLDEMDEDVVEEAVAREKKDLERLWESKTLREGSAMPPADPALMTRAIERHFKLPQRPKV
jgi:hypothetical protein